MVMGGGRDRFMMRMVGNKKQSDNSRSEEICQSFKGLVGRLFDSLGRGVSTFLS